MLNKLAYLIIKRVRYRSRISVKYIAIVNNVYYNSVEIMNKVHAILSILSVEIAVHLFCIKLPFIYSKNILPYIGLLPYMTKIKTI